MGQDVVDVDSLLSEVIRRICKKLCSLKVLPYRDFQTVRSLSLAFSFIFIFSMHRYDPSLVPTIVVINLLSRAFGIAKTEFVFADSSNLFICYFEGNKCIPCECNMQGKKLRNTHLYLRPKPSGNAFLYVNGISLPTTVYYTIFSIQFYRSSHRKTAVSASCNDMF